MKLRFSRSETRSAQWKVGGTKGFEERTIGFESRSSVLESDKDAVGHLELEFR